MRQNLLDRTAPASDLFFFSSLFPAVPVISLKTNEQAGVDILYGCGDFAKCMCLALFFRCLCDASEFVESNKHTNKNKKRSCNQTTAYSLTNQSSFIVRLARQFPLQSKLKDSLVPKMSNHWYSCCLTSRVSLAGHQIYVRTFFATSRCRRYLLASVCPEHTEDLVPCPV